jgi:phage terminase large subunit
VRIPYTPRPLQQEIHDLLAKTRFVVAVCHRRFGKSVLAVNHLIRRALVNTRDRPRTAYIGPTYRQTKTVVWDYAQHYSRPVPGIEINQSELRIDYPNKGQVRLYGADNPDALRGIYLDDFVGDEFGMQPKKVFSEVLRPALSDRVGGGLIIGTPNGKNQFWELAEYAKTSGDPDWAFIEYKASQTGYVAQEELDKARLVMTSDEYAQEYECSFDAAVKGAIYARELDAARVAGRIVNVPLEPILPVDTDWDLGVGDSTAIWFTQSLRSGEVRVIDYYEASGEGLPHYASVLRQKGYTYGTHWAPHDIQVRELASGRSRLETAAQLGIPFRICPKVDLEDGIHAARMVFPRCWFDAVKCKAGLEALQHYRRDYNERLNEFKATPVHDWASHGADAFRYLAVRQQVPVEKRRVQSAPMPTGGWH